MIRALLLCLLLGGSGRAQPLSLNDPVWTVSGGGGAAGGGYDGTLQSLPGIHTYWVWTNGVSVNELSRVTNWAALVAPGPNAFRSAGSQAINDPLNATNGVFFRGWDDGSFLTSTIVSFPSNQSYSVGMIQKLRHPDSGSNPTLIRFRPGSSPDSAIYTSQSDTNLLLDIRSSGSFSLPFSAGYLGTNRSDFMIVCSNAPTPGEGGGIYAYVDGILRTNKVDAGWTNFMSNWSIIGASTVAGGSYYDGWIFDLVFYTNALSSQNISNFHHWNTNVYGPTGSGT